MLHQVRLPEHFRRAMFNCDEAGFGKLLLIQIDVFEAGATNCLVLRPKGRIPFELGRRRGTRAGSCQSFVGVLRRFAGHCDDVQTFVTPDHTLDCTGHRIVDQPEQLKIPALEHSAVIS